MSLPGCLRINSGKSKPFSVLSNMTGRYTFSDFHCLRCFQQNFCGLKNSASRWGRDLPGHGNPCLNDARRAGREVWPSRFQWGRCPQYSVCRVVISSYDCSCSFGRVIWCCIYLYIYIHAYLTVSYASQYYDFKHPSLNMFGSLFHVS